MTRQVVKSCWVLFLFVFMVDQVLLADEGDPLLPVLINVASPTKPPDTRPFYRLRRLPQDVVPLEIVMDQESYERVLRALPGEKVQVNTFRFPDHLIQRPDRVALQLAIQMEKMSRHDNNRNSDELRNAAEIREILVGQSFEKADSAEKTSGTPQTVPRVQLLPKKVINYSTQPATSQSSDASEPGTWRSRLSKLCSAFSQLSGK